MEGGVGKDGRGGKKNSRDIKFSETHLIKFSYYFYRVIVQCFTCISL